MARYSKEFKSGALKLSDEIGVKKAAAQSGVPYYTPADWRNNRKNAEPEPEQAMPAQEPAEVLPPEEEPAGAPGPEPDGEPMPEETVQAAEEMTQAAEEPQEEEKAEETPAPSEDDEDDLELDLASLDALVNQFQQRLGITPVSAAPLPADVNNNENQPDGETEHEQENEETKTPEQQDRS